MGGGSGEAGGHSGYVVRGAGRLPIGKSSERVMGTGRAVGVLVAV